MRFANFFGLRNDHDAVRFLHRTNSSSPADKESASRAACGMTIWYLLLKVTVLAKAPLPGGKVITHITLPRVQASDAKPCSAMPHSVNSLGMGA